MRINIGGDLYIGQDSIDLSSEIISEFNSTDYNIINLEAPVIVDKFSKETKTGPSLFMLPSAVAPILEKLKVNICCLANNHINDYGPKGVFDTKGNLSEMKINYLGLVDKPNVTLSKDDLTLRIINACEKEWSVTDDKTFSAVHMNTGDLITEIIASRRMGYHVVVILHGGHENFSLPSLRMKNDSHAYIDAGADLVVWHHAHCFSGVENYNGCKIYYGIGNFIFQGEHGNRHDNIGMYLQLVLNKNGLTVNEKFLEYNNTEKIVYRLSGSKEEDCITRMDNLSEVIADSEALLDHWQLWVEKKRRDFYYLIGPFGNLRNRYLKYILKKTRFSELFFGPERRRLLAALIRCESHRELLEDILLQKE